MEEKVQVAVRLRPLTAGEVAAGVEKVVDVFDQSIVIRAPKDTEKADIRPFTFTFDFSYDSSDRKSRTFASQETVFSDLGMGAVDHGWKGYNACIFAYGQTGSGKSYSMMGYGDDKGIIPRACDELFARIQAAQESETDASFLVEVSYLEIYNEAVRDLLSQDVHSKHGLPVRENKAVGVYVQGLSKLVVKSFADIQRLIDDGNRCRTVARTKMNDVSSRSHSVFTVYFTQKRKSASGERALFSKLNLIDLAGSERQAQTQSEGDRLKEACKINKSLSALGNVISALAERSKGKGTFVPYRDSILTRLLQESLGGNSRTVMVAALSPAAANYEETLSTLKYADRAKRIVNVARVNEQRNEAAIDSLQSEVERLQRMLAESKNSASGITDDEYRELEDRLAQREELIDELRMSVEERERRSAQINAMRQEALADMGISIGELTSAFDIDADTPHLVNLNADRMMTENLIYFLRPCGRNGSATRIGTAHAQEAQDIVLSGPTIEPEHCIIRTDPTGRDVTITPLEHARTFVNGVEITGETPLPTGSRVIIGRGHIFRFNNPQEVREIREQRRSEGLPEEDTREADFDFAVAELAAARGQSAVAPDSEAGLILRLAEGCDDANDICELMGKKCIFSVELHDNPTTGKREVGVRASNFLSQTTTLWSVPKFEARLARMHDIVDGEPDPASVRLDPDDDPFFDPPADYLIGRVRVPLRPLLKGRPVGGWFPLMSSEGATAGQLSLDLSLTRRGGDTGGTEEAEVVVRVREARDLPLPHCCGVFVRFLFPADAEQVTERAGSRPTPAPALGYRDSFTLPLTDEWTLALKLGDITFEVWGHERLDSLDAAHLSAQLQERDDEAFVLRYALERNVERLDDMQRRFSPRSTPPSAEKDAFSRRKATFEASLARLTNIVPSLSLV